MSHASECGVAGMFLVLGVVPYDDMLSLMMHSVAVINPSLFEGWSTTVEEAKALGKMVILSRIPVHLEQAPRNGVYFDPGSFADLAETMAKAWQAREMFASLPAAALERENEDRRLAFGRNYEEIVLGAL